MQRVVDFQLGGRRWEHRVELQACYAEGLGQGFPEGGGLAFEDGA
jgi:hypothetical protein